MTSYPHAPSARILLFTPRPRGAAVAPIEARVIEFRPAAPSVVHCPAVSYHEAAIAEERARKT